MFHQQTDIRVPDICILACTVLPNRLERADALNSLHWLHLKRIFGHVARLTANDGRVLARLRGEDRIAFRYLDNPNGSVDGIAGVLSANRRVCGMMPHPERLISEDLGGMDGAILFESALATIND